MYFFISFIYHSSPQTQGVAQGVPQACLNIDSDQIQATALANQTQTLPNYALRHSALLKHFLQFLHLTCLQIWKIKILAFAFIHISNKTHTFFCFLVLCNYGSSWLQ